MRFPRRLLLSGPSDRLALPTKVFARSGLLRATTCYPKFPSDRLGTRGGYSESRPNARFGSGESTAFSRSGGSTDRFAMKDTEYQPPSGARSSQRKFFCESYRVRDCSLEQG